MGHPMSQITSSPSPVDDQQKSSHSDRISFKRNHFFLTLVPVAFVCGLAVGFLAWGREVSSGTGRDPVASPREDKIVPQSDNQVQRLNVSADDDPFVGPENATVTIIEFSDFECAYCVRFYKDTLGSLLDSYPAEIRFVYRDFPLVSIHPNAKPAAEAAQCAFAQDKFWEFHNQLFENQTQLGDRLYLKIASDIGLDMAAFEQCYSSSAFSEEVSNDFESGRRLGVTGTPTFFVNGRPLIGAQPLSAFTAIIEEELAARGP